MGHASLNGLERQRERLYAQLAATGDVRWGSVSENYAAAGNRIARARSPIIARGFCGPARSRAEAPRPGNFRPPGILRGWANRTISNLVGYRRLIPG